MTASAIGWVSLLGGRSFIPGTLIVSIALGKLCKGLTLLNVQAIYQLIATGIITIVAMLIYKFASGAGDGKQRRRWANQGPKARKAG